MLFNINVIYYTFHSNFATNCSDELRMHTSYFCSSMEEFGISKEQGAESEILFVFDSEFKEPEL